MLRSGTLRAVLRPGPLALLALALGLATGFAFLGQWQLARSQAVDEASPVLESPRPLAEVLTPATTFRNASDGQVVTATGRFGAELVGDPAAGAGGQVLVAGRDQDGRDGSWVVAPFRVTGPGGGAPGTTGPGDAADPADAGGAADDGAPSPPGEGSAAPVVPVVLGWVDPRVAAEGADALPPPPSGEVSLTGRLLAGEPPQGLVPGPDGSVVTAVSPPDLVNVWDGRLYTGFVVAAEPVAGAPLLQVSTTPPLRSTDWRSFSYALQWWLFAGFAVYFWWRIVRDRVLPEAEASERARAQEGEGLLAALEARRARERPSGPDARPAPGTDPRHDHVEAR